VKPAIAHDHAEPFSDPFYSLLQTAGTESKRLKQKGTRV